MSNIYGSLSLPTPSRTSHITNDSCFLSVHDYTLNLSNLYGEESLEISDIPNGSLITRVELRVTTAFATNPDEQHNIEISDENDTVLMDNDWNDPNVVGNYSTDCYYSVSGSLIVTHDLSAMTAGAAILRIYAYDVVA